MFWLHPESSAVKSKKYVVTIFYLYFLIVFTILNVSFGYRWISSSYWRNAKVQILNWWDIVDNDTNAVFGKDGVKVKCWGCIFLEQWLLS